MFYQAWLFFGSLIVDNSLLLGELTSFVNKVYAVARAYFSNSDKHKRGVHFPYNNTGFLNCDVITKFEDSNRMLADIRILHCEVFKALQVMKN